MKYHKLVTFRFLPIPALFLLTGLLIFSLSLRSLPAKEFIVKISGELGNFHTNDSFFKGQNDLLSRFRATLNYKRNRGNTAWFVYSKFFPEFYGTTNAARIFKFSFGGQFQKQFNKLQFSAFVSRQINNYRANPENFTAGIFNIGTSAVWWFNSGLFGLTGLQYYYRDITNTTDQNLDALVLQAKIGKNFTKYFSFEAGVYGENFTVESRDYWRRAFFESPGNIFPDDQWKAGKSTGWRLGPQISWRYQKHSLIHFTYRLLSHHSLVIKKPAWEHRLQTVFGKLLSRKISLLFLLDYYFSQVEFTGDPNYLLTYFPLQNENKIFLKLENTLDKRKTIYLKTGYLKNTFKFENFSISGWLLVAGTEFSF